MLVIKVWRCLDTFLTLQKNQSLLNIIPQRRISISYKNADSPVRIKIVTVACASSAAAIIIYLDMGSLGKSRRRQSVRPD